MELRVFKRLLLNGLCSAQLVPAVNDGHLAGELREVHCLLNGRIAAADHIHFKVFKKRCITCGAEGNALADELAFVFAADGARERAGGKDHGLCEVFALHARELLRLAGKLHAFDGIPRALHAELFRLRGHAGDQGGAGFAFKLLSGIVFDFIGDGDLSAILPFFNDEGGKAGPAGIQAGSQARRACTQDDHIVNLAHFTMLQTDFGVGRLRDPAGGGLCYSSKIV